VQNLNKIVTIGRVCKRFAGETGASVEPAQTKPGALMTRIISVIPLVLACILGVPGAVAQDEPLKEASPATDSDAQTGPTAAPTTEPAAEGSSDIKLQDHPPARYTVKRGDTLWGISSRFLKNPWKWPDVWGMNRDQVKNPHLIYPGEVIILDLSGATPRLRLEGVADGGLSRWYGYELQVSKLEPHMRSKSLTAAIPTIAAKDIEPFLTRPMIVDPDAIALAPRIVATTDDRVILGVNDRAYATGLDERKGGYWNLYRPGRVFQDPDTKETLGYEAVYLGDAEVQSFGEVSTVRILRAQQEVSTGDRLTVIPALQSLPYVPHEPEKKVRGKIIAGTNSTVAEIGPLSVVIMNRGAREGLESGHVLGLYRSEGKVAVGDRVVPLPEQQYGLVLVFKVFNRMSYGLIMTAKRPVHLNDVIRNP
jgi:LysM repeat protein